MSTQLRTTKLRSLQGVIKTLAAEGRAKRTEAQSLTHGARHRAKCDANLIGTEARIHLLAYAVLRGRDITSVESPSTRTPFTVNNVLDIVVEFYTPVEGVEIEVFLAEHQAKLHAWNKVCTQNEVKYSATGGRRSVEKIAEAA